MIWLHGLGDTAYGFLDIFYTPSFQMAPSHAKIVLLTAPTREVTLNMGMQMTSWYDIVSLDTSGLSKNIDLNQLNESWDIILNFVDQEAQIFDNDYSKVFIGGFSQGWWMAYSTFLNCKHTIGGLIAVSGHTPPLDDIKISEEKKAVPIFSYHGQDDPMVPEGLHRAGAKVLKDHGLNISYKIEPGLQHSLSMDEINDIKQFLNNHMK